MVVIFANGWLCTVKHRTMYNLSTILYCFMVYRLCIGNKAKTIKNNYHETCNI